MIYKSCIDNGLPAGHVKADRARHCDAVLVGRAVLLYRIALPTFSSDALRKMRIVIKPALKTNAVFTRNGDFAARNLKS